MMSAEAEKNTDSNDDENPMGKLEEALVVCGFGWFNIVLLIAIFCAASAATMVTTTSSYIMPIAECDLDMSLMQKGILNAMPFFGQVGVAFVTGFLADAFGRKLMLVGGHFGIFVCTILEASSQNYWVLITGKFAEGIFLSVTYTTASVMVTEFTHKNIRNRILMVWASFNSLSLIIIALTSWGILPQKWDFVILEEYFELHSWNIYLYVSAIWSIIAAILFYCLPESPKYLLSQGQESEALEILKNVYKINTGNDKHTFPITSLFVSEKLKPSEKTTLRKKLVETLHEMKNLLRPPLCSRLFLFLFLGFVLLFSYSSIRLWYPQMSSIIENYAIKHGSYDRFCIMIDDYTQSVNSSIKLNDTESSICVPQLSGFDTYMNGIIMGLVSFLSLALNGYLVKFIGQKLLMAVALILCALCAGSLYWTNTIMQIAILLSMTCALMQTALSLLFNIVVRVFPTSLRSLSLSLILVSGRTGSLTGSIVFPIMLQTACMTPFINLFVICICVSGIIYFLPNPDKENNGTGDR